jgi:hypothetical protein
LWIPLDRFLHREIVQIMREHDAPDRVERPRGQIVDEQAVIVIDIGRSDIVETNAPVERVILPDDRLQAERVCNIANAVLCRQQKA